LPPLTILLAELARRDRERDRLNVAAHADAIRARCQNFAGFVREAWHILEPNATYVHSWHVDAICEHLEAVTYGQITRLLINVPPGSIKSLLVSVLWQAWEWGPKGLRSHRFLTTAFSEGPVKRDTRKCRDLIMSEWYQSLWPEVELTRTGEMSFANSSTGTREGVPFGSLTSQRGDRLIVDDPHSTETAESETERTTTTRKFREGAVNRLNDQTRSAIVVIMQRLHADDISGVIKKYGMEFIHLCLPMEFEVETACSTEIGFSDPREHDGDLLDPIRFPREAIEKLKRDMGSYAWAAQYQQRPSPREGGMFKRHWFKIIDASPAEAAKRQCRSWDLAGSIPKPGRDPDWTIGLKMSELEGKFYIEHVLRMRDIGFVVRQAIKNCASQDGIRCKIRIPQDAAQAGKDQATSIIAENAGYVISADRETGEKAVRAEPFAAQCEAGNVYLVKGDWNDAFIDELCGFPSVAHDDQLDAAAGAFRRLVTDFTGDSIIQRESLLFDGQPVLDPMSCKTVFATIATSFQNGKTEDAIAVVFWSFDQTEPIPLHVLDWEITQITGDWSGPWLASVYERLVAFAKKHLAHNGPSGVWIENRGSASVLLEAAKSRRWMAYAIDNKLVTMGTVEKAVSASGYVASHKVKLTRGAYERTCLYRGVDRNHLVGQIISCRIGAKQAQPEEELLKAFLDGTMITLGNRDGY